MFCWHEWHLYLYTSIPCYSLTSFQEVIRNTNVSLEKSDYKLTVYYVQTASFSPLYLTSYHHEVYIIYLDITYFILGILLLEKNIVEGERVGLTFFQNNKVILKV